MRPTSRYCLIFTALGLFAVGARSQQAADVRPAAGESPSADAPLLQDAPHLRFQHLTNEDGLSLNLVWSMLQDRRGFMWFGTEDGLNRYDGYRFTVYESVPFDSTSLLDDDIYALAEDQEGALWIGTPMGISRLDPHTGGFRQYRHDKHDPNSLRPGRVSALAVEPSGVVWVGMFENGLSRLDPRTGRFRHYRHDPGEATSLSSDRIRKLYRDVEGVLWVATTNGLNRLTPSGGSGASEQAGGVFRHYLYEPAGLGPNEGLHDFSSAPQAVRAGIIQAVCDDPGERGMLWVGTGDGLVRLDTRTGQARRFTPDPARPNGNVVSAVLPDPRAPGVLWVASRDGLYHFAVRTERFTRYRHDPDDRSSISGEYLRGLVADRTGLLWVQTNVEGIERFDPAGTAFFHGRFVPEGGPATGTAVSVSSLAEDLEGRLWFTSDAGLARLDRTTGLFTRYRDDPSAPSDFVDDVFILYTDRGGALWLGRAGGVVDRLNPAGAGGADAATGRLTRFARAEGLLPGRMTTFYEDRAGAVWAGGSAGLSRLDAGGQAFVRIPLGSPARGEGVEPVVFDLVEDAAGAFWVGTHQGLLRLDRDTGAVTTYGHDPRDSTSLSTDVVYTLHERVREPGILWLGTTGGLDRFDTRTGRATHFTVADGLPNGTIWALLEDERGHLWMSTNNGLSDFDPDRRAFTNYGTDVGLQSQEFNLGVAYRSPRTGELFFGGINGFNAFFPARLTTRNPHPPAVVLTGLRIANHPVTVSADGPLRAPIEEAEEVRLRRSERTVTFEYVGLHYQDPAQNRYAYRLDGFDDAWVEAGTERTATYTNLDPGTYTFRVRAASSDGVWSEGAASVRLMVLPAWWQTVWARLAGVLVAAGLAFAVHRLREGRRRAARALRLRIAHDLHDEMGSGLSQVSLYSELIRRTAEGTAGGNGSPESDSARMAAWAARVGEQAGTLSGSMRDVVWAVRPDEPHWEALELRMKDAAVALLAPRGIEVDMQGEVDGATPALPPEVRQNVLLFFKEAVHNAARHAAPTRLEVRWRLSRRALSLRITDDGQGFDPATARRGTGLLSLRRRAAELGGTFVLTTAPGEGTRLLLEVPLGRPWPWQRRTAPPGKELSE